MKNKKHKISNEEYISNLRSKCKNETDDRFVDAMESIMSEFEKPRVEPEYFIPIGAFTESWDNALRQFMDEHKGKAGFSSMDPKGVVNIGHPVSTIVTIKKKD